jgi:hypothetical protein|tara:strand:+ start:249 stop:770 length:522 start_codon:yes stop_codon:yes gene_type:complete
MAEKDIKDIKPDLDAQLNEAFNSMIGEVLADLARETISPVYTGFLASSWRAQKRQVRQKDRVEDHEPWAGIKANFVWKKKGDKPPNPKIEPRFSPPTFDYRKGCFIGNQAEYSSYVIEDPGLVKYLKNDIKNTINSNFKEKKRGAIKLGTVQKKVLFGKGSKKGRKYTGTSEF